MAQILIFTMKYNCPPEDFERMCWEVADETRGNEKWMWKIWANDKENRIGKTIYLLRDSQEVEEAVQWIEFMTVMAHELLESHSTEVLEVQDTASLLNNAPLPNIPTVETINTNTPVHSPNQTN